MKKLLAILLSVLMLCAMIPVATVAAEEYDVPTMVASTVEEANAGDEIQIEVLLVNNPGVITVAAEVVYDKSVMELVTYYDEDEEADMNMIEVGPGFNASSNKYITIGPLGKCSAFFSRGTAKNNVTNELFYTATFKIKEDAPSGTYPLTITFKPKSSVNLAKEFVEFEVATTYITINGTEAPDECNHEYTYACDKVCNKCYELTNENAAHSVKHVEAVAASCTANGNVEHWYCEYCGIAWLDEALTQVTNLKSVVLPAIGEHTYDNDKDADCNLCGEVREVATAKPGDLNGDGRVNNRDLGLLQQHLGDWDVTIDLDAADVNDDGRVNNRDLGLIQQYLGDWDVELK